MTKEKIEQFKKISQDNAKEVAKSMGAYKENIKAGLNSFVGAADQYAEIQGRLGLITGDQAQLEQMNRSIFKSAQQARVPYQDIANTVANLGTSAKDAFSNQDEMVQFAELAAKSFRIAGMEAGEQSGIMSKLTTDMANGSMSGGFMASLITDAPLLADALSNALGVGREQLIHLAEQGAMTSEVMKNAMLLSGEEINAQFAQLPLTFSDVVQSMKNYFIETLQPAFQLFSTWLNSESAVQMMESVRIGLAMVGAALTFVAQMASAVATFFSNNWSVIGPIIWGIVAAITAYRTAVMIATVAQQAMNTIMSLNPIGLIIGLVVGLILAFLALIAACDPVREFFANTFRFLGDITAKVVGFMIDLWAGFYNDFIDIVNLLLEGVNKVVNAIGSFIGLDSEINLELSKIDTSQFKEGIQDGIEGAFDAAANGIESFDIDAIKSTLGLEDLQKGPEAPPDDPLNQPFGDFGGGDLSGSVSNIDQNTAGMRDGMDLNTEEIKYLREVAEQDAINRFTTAEVKLDMKNELQVNSDLDIDGVVRHIEEQMGEAMAVAAEGVYE
ncbi:tape measure protein [Longirhabdus pacifica]|uniref:tape measure protein n=1 Tax=Longirhabdus pacifica TaxID=2305227 RepID=UPI0013E898E9|nr:tape measure protein [Longirhabdus pacifica]